MLMTSSSLEAPLPLYSLIISKLNVDFSLKHLGEFNYFLSIEVKKGASQSLVLTQTKYIKDLLLKTNMLDCTSVNTPMQSTCKLTKVGVGVLTFVSSMCIGRLPTIANHLVTL